MPSPEFQIAKRFSHHNSIWKALNNFCVAGIAIDLLCPYVIQACHKQGAEGPYVPPPPSVFGKSVNSISTRVGDRLGPPNLLAPPAPPVTTGLRWCAARKLIVSIWGRSRSSLIILSKVSRGCTGGGSGCGCGVGGRGCSWKMSLRSSLFSSLWIMVLASTYSLGPSPTRLQRLHRKGRGPEGHCAFNCILLGHF